MNRRLLFCSFLSLQILTCLSYAAAQDMSQLDFNFGAEGGAHYFDFEETDYGTYIKTPDNPQFVSDQEFENAIRTKEKYGLSYKQRKRAEKNRKRQHQMNQERDRERTKYDKTSPLALLRLPVAVVINDKPVRPGFYLLDYRVLEDKMVVDFFQGRFKIGSLIVDNVQAQPGKVNGAFTDVQFDNTGNVILTLNTSQKVITINLNTLKQ